MDEQRLNRKLAKWAGFVGIIDYLPNQFSVGHPSQQSGLFVKLNFTKSLDACFKWLVPKLEQAGYKYEICATTSPTEHRVTIKDRAFKFVEMVSIEDPALALCLAIEKVIE